MTPLCFNCQNKKLVQALLCSLPRTSLGTQNVLMYLSLCVCVSLHLYAPCVCVCVCVRRVRVPVCVCVESGVKVPESISEGHIYCM